MDGSSGAPSNMEVSSEDPHDPQQPGSSGTSMSNPSTSGGSGFPSSLMNGLPGGANAPLPAMPPGSGGPDAGGADRANNTVGFKDSLRLFSPGQLAQSASDQVFGPASDQTGQEDWQRKLEARAAWKEQQAQEITQRQQSLRQQQFAENRGLVEQIAQVGGGGVASKVPLEPISSSRVESQRLQSILSAAIRAKQAKAAQRSQAPRSTAKGPVGPDSGEKPKASMMDQMMSGGEISKPKNEKPNIAEWPLGE